MHFRALLINPERKPPGIWLKGNGSLTDDLVEAKLFENATELREEVARIFDQEVFGIPMALIFTADGNQFLIKRENILKKAE